MFSMYMLLCSRLVPFVFFFARTIPCFLRIYDTYSTMYTTIPAPIAVPKYILAQIGDSSNALATMPHHRVLTMLQNDGRGWELRRIEGQWNTIRGVSVGSELRSATTIVVFSHGYVMVLEYVQVGSLPWARFFTMLMPWYRDRDLESDDLVLRW